MLAQLSRRVRSSSTMRIWTLALAAGVSESGSVMPSGWVGLSGPEPAGSAVAAAERIAVVSIARPCKSPPHGVGGHAVCDLAHTTRRRVQCRDRAHPPARTSRAATAFTTDLGSCQDGLLLNCNNFLCQSGAMSQFRDSFSLRPRALPGTRAEPQGPWIRARQAQ